jgi:hypothetical protein
MPIMPTSTIAPPSPTHKCPVSIHRAAAGSSLETPSFDTFALATEHQKVTDVQAARVPPPLSGAVKTCEAPHTVRPACALDSDVQWMNCCKVLRQRLISLEKNEVLRNELQTRFVDAIESLPRVDSKILEECFDRAFSDFSVSRPQRHWTFLADVFKPTYISEALRVFSEAGLVSSETLRSL